LETSGTHCGSTYRPLNPSNVFDKYNVMSKCKHTRNIDKKEHNVIR